MPDVAALRPAARPHSRTPPAAGLAHGIRATACRSTPPALHRLLRLLQGPAWVLALLLTMSAGAQAPRVAPQTGDAWLDATLVDMDRYALRFPGAFRDELNRYYAAPRGLLTQLLDARRWPPGDVYLACALARVAAQPCRAVAAARSQQPAQSWAAIALRFGVAVDSPAFHRLKRDAVLSYGHWARPLQVDASLRADFPKLPLQPIAPTPSPLTPAARAPRKAGAP